MDLAPGTIRRKGNDIAIKTAPNVTAGRWFIYNPASGGGYTDGVAEGVEANDSEWETVG